MTKKKKKRKKKEKKTSLFISSLKLRFFLF